MPDSPAIIGGGPPAVALDEGGNIREDFACGACGYSLRGQALDGKCSECGSPVERSVRMDLLRHSDPRWVRRIARGFVPLMICTVLTLTFHIAYRLAMDQFVMGAPNQLLGMRNMNVLTWFSLGTMTCLNGLMLCGVWMITTQEPKRALEPAWLRPTARCAMLIVTILTLCQWIPWVISIAFGISAQWFQPYGQIVRIVQISASVAGMSALFILARRLAFRIPDEPLARRTTIAAFGIIAIMTLNVLFSMTILFMPLGQLRGTASQYVAHIPQGVVTVWAMVLLMQYRRAIRGAIKAD